MSEQTKDAIVIERTFEAPATLVWQMWTEPEHFKQWYGPHGFNIPVAQMDVRVGGKRLICMEAADGSMKMWMAGEFTEVNPTERLVYTDNMSDEHGNLVPASAYGLNSDQPLMTLVTVSLQEMEGHTKMVVTHAGVPEDEEGATEGWSQSFTKLADYLATHSA